jgi:hypothetical protein
MKSGFPCRILSNLDRRFTAPGQHQSLIQTSSTVHVGAVTEQSSCSKNREPQCKSIPKSAKGWCTAGAVCLTNAKSITNERFAADFLVQKFIFSFQKLPRNIFTLKYKKKKYRQIYFHGEK